MVTTETQSIIVSLFMELDPVVSSETWKTWELAEQVKLSDFLIELHKVFGSIKSQFDSTVWDGHANGTVDKTVKSVRTQSSRTSSKKTDEGVAKLEKLLGRKVTTTTEEDSK